MTVYNPQQVMRQFGYDQGVVLLTGKLCSSSVPVVEARFTGHDMSKSGG